MRRFDLNLLYVLRELLDEPNTTKVGEKLGLTQSAVSASLNRLRWAFEDDLLVRSGRGMTPTRRADKLREPVKEILALIDRLADDNVRFDPAQLKRTFRLTTADFLAAQVVSPLLMRLGSESPHAKLRCETISGDTRARIRSGHIDVLVAPMLPIEEKLTSVAHKVVYEDELVCVVSKDNDQIGDTLSMDEFLNARHAAFVAEFTHDVETTADTIMARLGINVNVVCEFSSIIVLPYALRGTSLISTVPRRLAMLMPEIEHFRLLPVPFEASSFPVSMIWNESFDQDAEHQWFRNAVEEIIRGLG